MKKFIKIIHTHVDKNDYRLFSMNIPQVTNIIIRTYNWIYYTFHTFNIMFINSVEKLCKLLFKVKIHYFIAESYQQIKKI